MSKVAQMKSKTLPIKPAGHYILIKPDPVETMTASGIVTGTQSQHEREHVASIRGTLVGVGSGAWLAFDQGDPWAHVGDHVYFKRHVADRIEDKSDMVDGKPQEYFLMADENLLAVIDD